MSGWLCCAPVLLVYLVSPPSSYLPLLLFNTPRVSCSRPHPLPSTTRPLLLLASSLVWQSPIHYPHPSIHIPLSTSLVTCCPSLPPTTPTHIYTYDGSCVCGFSSSRACRPSSSARSVARPSEWRPPTVRERSGSLREKWPMPIYIGALISDQKPAPLLLLLPQSITIIGKLHFSRQALSQGGLRGQAKRRAHMDWPQWREAFIAPCS